MSVNWLFRSEVFFVSSKQLAVIIAQCFGALLNLPASSVLVCCKITQSTCRSQKSVSTAYCPFLHDRTITIGFISAFLDAKTDCFCLRLVSDTLRLLLSLSYE